MSFPTVLNSQVTDAVSQANLKVVGDAPATGVGDLFVATSQALSNAAHNAATGGQQTGLTSQATTTQGVGMLYSVDTSATGKATRAELRARARGLIRLQPPFLPRLSGRPLG